MEEECNRCQGLGCFNATFTTMGETCPKCQGTGRNLNLRVVVVVGPDGISVPTCPVGVTVEIQESADGYRHTSRYDHTGRLD